MSIRSSIATRPWAAYLATAVAGVAGVYAGALAAAVAPITTRLVVAGTAGACALAGDTKGDLRIVNTCLATAAGLVMPSVVTGAATAVAVSEWISKSEPVPAKE